MRSNTIPLLGAIVMLSDPATRVKERQIFSCGKYYYRTLFLDVNKDALYVGAADRIFKLPASNINDSTCEKNHVELEPEDVSACTAKGKTEDYECRNHIKVIIPLRKDLMYACGTNAFKPKDFTFTESLSINPHNIPGVGDGFGKCPYGPDDSATSIFIDKGNPEDAPGFYTAISADEAGTDKTIVRTDLIDPLTNERKYPPLRTIHNNTVWLNEPEFISSYAINHYVYYFFHERALEISDYGDALYSRVARVCKKDRGGQKPPINQIWTSFLKARLTCAVPGEFPFHFDKIMATTKSDRGDMIYAAFTSTSPGIFGSAVCAYSLEAIDKAFRGAFKGQKKPSYMWTAVPSSKVPDPRPGTCMEDSHEVNETYTQFHEKHVLMDRTVEPLGGRPIYYEPGATFTAIAVDHRRNRDGTKNLIYYVGTIHGRVYKIVQGKTNESKPFSYPVDQWRLDFEEPVRRMAISPDFVYLAFDSGVVQVSLYVCKRHKEKKDCKRDPYCKWENCKCVADPPQESNQAE